MRAFVSQARIVVLSVFIASSLAASSNPPVFNAGFAAGPADSKPSFITQGLGYSVWLTPDEAVVRTRSTFRMKWLNASSRRSIGGRRVLHGKANYFLGNDPAKWRTKVGRYAEVKYRNVYDGIDLVFHTRTGQLEYDWIVSPGADPSRIQVAFPNADRIWVAENGDLVVSIDGVEIRQHRPVIFQRDRRVAGGYRLHPGNRVTFELGKYDRNKPLTIDPVLSYSTYLGGSGNDGAFSIAVDSAGNAYVAGLTRSPDFPAASGLGAGNGTGRTRAFVAKLNPAGTDVLYLAYMGGSDEDLALGIAVDASGSAYVTGGTHSPDFPTTAGAVQRTYGGTGGSSQPPSFDPAGDAFVAKLNPSGDALVYSTYLGGRGGDQGYGIRVDAGGNAYVAGTTSPGLPDVPETFPTTRDALQGRRGGTTDGFVAKLNPTGTTLLYSTFVGGENDEYVFGLDIDGSGSAYITGITGSSRFPVTTGSLQTSATGSPMAFVSKLNATGTALAYSTYLGGSGYNAAYGIAVDPAGNAYVTGVTNSTDFPVTAGAFATPNRAPGAQGDVFAVKLNAMGDTLLYSSVFGGNGTDYGTSITVDSNGNAYVAGRTFYFGSTYSTIPTTTNALKRCGSNDAFVAKLDTAGSTLLYSSHLGGRGMSAATGIAVGADFSVWVTGSTSSDDFPVTTGAFQSAYRGVGPGAFDSDNLMPFGGDAFVTKMDLSGPGRPQVGCVVNAASFGPGPISPGTIVAILGGGMGPETGVEGTVVDGQVTTSIAGTRVLFDGIPAPLLYVRSDQINAVVPYGIHSGSTNIQVEYGGEKTDVLSTAVVEATPAAFTTNASGVGQAAVLNQDGSINSPANPARPGSVISAFVTGLGRTDPPGVDGQLNDTPLSKPVLSVGAYVAGMEAEIQYAGAAPGLVAGAFQINIVVPAIPFGSATTPFTVIVLDSRGFVAGAQNGLTIAVR